MLTRAILIGLTISVSPGCERIGDARKALEFGQTECSRQLLWPREYVGTFIARPSAQASGRVMRATADVTPQGRLITLAVGDAEVDVKDLSLGPARPAVISTSLTLQDEVTPGTLLLGRPAKARLTRSSDPARFRGPVQVSVSQTAADGTAVTQQLTATATFEVTPALRAGTLTVDVGAVAEGVAPVFSRLVWSGLSACGTAFGSNGAGEVALFDGRGRKTSPVNFGAPSDEVMAVIGGDIFDQPPDGARVVSGAFTITGASGAMTGVLTALSGG